MREPQLFMCETTDPFGHAESEPLVVSVDEVGWVRLEMEDGTVWRCPPEFREAIGDRDDELRGAA